MWKRWHFRFFLVIAHRGISERGLMSRESLLVPTRVAR